jgi:hypothetical protein
VKLVIPWHFFFRSLRKQLLTSREDWLTYFAFDDPGVTLLPDVPISLEEILRDALTLKQERDKRELEVLAELTERKRARLYSESRGHNATGTSTQSHHTQHHRNRRPDTSAFAARRA